MVSMVNDINGTVPPLDFQFDGAGNMTLQSVPDPNMGRHERLLCWDEENRLSATRDQYYATANMYDASGNRAWKLGGEVNWMWNNGQGWQAYGDLNLRTWYQSDLVTITDQAMTKHYFIAGQRIASKLAESLSPEVAQALKDKPVTPLSGDVNELGTNMTERLRRDFECVGLDYNAFYPGEPRIDALEVLQSAPETNEYQVFFYHSDHLGSSSFITDINGDATQHLQYLPFGEDFVHQQNTAAYYTQYTFSGKERDVETNLSYFGARYYESSLSVWLSVDPMSDKYPHESSFAYAGNSPVIFIDPDGREKILALDKNKDKAIIAGAQKYNDDNAIHVFAHGSSKGMSVVIDGKTTRIRTAKQLDKFLAKNSSIWQNRGDADQVTIILHSCNTGRDDNDGTESFAEKVSKSDIFKDATIIAPNERVYFSESGEIGAYKAEFANENGEYKRDANGEVKNKSRSENPGSWRIFQGGKQTGQFRGDWHPKEQPTTWDNLTKREL